jgi:putative peptide zinc metalloprotease protein
MTVTVTSTIRLHRLLYKEEDATDWIVGRIDSGEFVEVPAEAVTFLRAIEQDEDVAGAHARVLDQHGVDIDAVDFVDTLIDLGFVASLDGRPLGPAPRPPSLRWIRPSQVRWVFHWQVIVWVYAFIAAGLAAAIVRGQLIPSYRVYFITGSQSVNLAWNTAMLAAAIAIHEFWHLAAARADGVYARIGLGTRMQFLVAQTTVAGLWAAPRRLRIRVYLAGVTSDLVLISACSLAVTIAAPTGLAYRALEALTLSLVLTIANQFALYMRTDMYFVLQELLRCKNLYADAVDYARYAVATAVARITRRPRPRDPAAEMAPHERSRIKKYTLLMVLGSLVALVVFGCYDVPILITLFYRAGEHVMTGRPLQILDGLCVFAVEGTLQVIFLRLFFAKHMAKLRSLARLAARPLRPRSQLPAQGRVP